MFHKLRNRFMLLNLVIISVMMIIAFAAIYTITYRDVRTDIDMELHRIAEFYGRSDGPRERGPAGGSGPRPGLPMPDEIGGLPMPDRSVSFAIVTDEDWSLRTVVSPFAMDEAIYGEAREAVRTKDVNRGQMRLDGLEWAYEVRAVPGGGYRIVFLDVTARQGILTGLIYTFLAVGLLMLVAIAFISRFFANRAIAPVKDAFDKQKQFIADASHELKTPLAVIGTNADLLLANADDTIRNQARWVNVIQAETERMAKLTGDLLYLTQLEDARDAVMIAPFSASDAAEGVILAMEAIVYERKLTLEYQIEPGLTVMGSAEQFKQIVLILLDNAAKYTNSGGRIDVTLKRRHHDMTLAVSNTGEGIAAEHLGRIFDRFYRTDPSRSKAHGGYGLGLAIARAITEQHKGRISVKSVPKGRTTFTVTIPLHGI